MTLVDIHVRDTATVPQLFFTIENTRSLPRRHHSLDGSDSGVRLWSQARISSANSEPKAFWYSGRHHSIHEVPGSLAFLTTLHCIKDRLGARPGFGR